MPHALLTLWDVCMIMSDPVQPAVVVVDVTAEADRAVSLLVFQHCMLILQLRYSRRHDSKLSSEHGAAARKGSHHPEG